MGRQIHGDVKWSGMLTFLPFCSQNVFASAQPPGIKAQGNLADDNTDDADDALAAIDIQEVAEEQPVGQDQPGRPRAIHTRQHGGPLGRREK